MKGAADLLSANDIIKRLGITADEFQELVNLPNHYLRNTGGTFGEALYRSSRLFDSHIELINKDLEGKSTFPKPDFYILGKARWKKETFKKWLEEQHQYKTRQATSLPFLNRKKAILTLYKAIRLLCPGLRVRCQCEYYHTK